MEGIAKFRRKEKRMGGKRKKIWRRNGKVIIDRRKGRPERVPVRCQGVTCVGSRGKSGERSHTYRYLLERSEYPKPAGIVMAVAEGAEKPGRDHKAGQSEAYGVHVCSDARLKRKKEKGSGMAGGGRLERVARQEIRGANGDEVPLRTREEQKAPVAWVSVAKNRVESEAIHAGAWTETRTCPGRANRWREKSARWLIAFTGRRARFVRSPTEGFRWPRADDTAPTSFKWGKTGKKPDRKDNPIGAGRESCSRRSFPDWVVWLHGGEFSEAMSRSLFASMGMHTFLGGTAVTDKKRGNLGGKRFDTRIHPHKKNAANRYKSIPEGPGEGYGLLFRGGRVWWFLLAPCGGEI